MCERWIERRGHVLEVGAAVQRRGLERWLAKRVVDNASRACAGAAAQEVHIRVIQTIITEARVG